MVNAHGSLLYLIVNDQNSLQFARRKFFRNLSCASNGFAEKIDFNILVKKSKFDARKILVKNQLFGTLIT